MTNGAILGRFVTSIIFFFAQWKFVANTRSQGVWVQAQAKYCDVILDKKPFS